jgi:hypothetical protein
MSRRMHKDDKPVKRVPRAQSKMKSVETEKGGNRLRKLE